MYVQDLALPKTMVQRLAKGVLPPNTQIQKDALLAISKSATVFVNYLTSHANEQAQRMNKKTIQPKDVLDAIEDIEFGVFLERLNGELTKYNAVQCDKRNSYRRKVREEQKGKTVADADAEGEAPTTEGAVTKTNGVPVVTETRRDGDSEPQAKKVRGEDGMEIDEEEEDAPDEPEGEDEQESEAEDDDDDDDVEETFEDAKEQLAEDSLELKETQDEDMEDEALDEGEESD
jgi:histone H3/H4